jgi:hypothetical protein
VWQALLVVLLGACCGCARGEGRLEFRVLDAAGLPVPARIELIDEHGDSRVAAGALEINTECFTVPFPRWAASLQRARSLQNPYTETEQFYVDGTGGASLPAGRYRLTASRGIEHRLASAEVDVAAGATARVDLTPQRWIDMPAAGWYSADDHLHIARATPGDDARIGAWMRAEDLHIANLLQMGTAEHFDITPQYAFGDAGVYRAGGTQLVSGQEHPRTHVLGHTIILGAQGAIDRRDAYTVYRGFWEEAKRLGGAAGYAHWGAGRARTGLAVDAPSGLLTFIEVLQFDLPHYDVWYEMLNLGARLAPAAGTDYPCIPSLPGRERFYTRVDGPPSRAAWIEGVRRGRTFVTNGPMLELEIDGAGVGDELRLEGPRSVRILGRVRFDPTRDDVQGLELIRNGEVAAETAARTGSEISLDVAIEVSAPAWFALRATGGKVGETRMQTPWYLSRQALRLGCRFGCGASIFERTAYVGSGRVRPSAAHTAPIYVSIAGVEAKPPAALVRGAIERLDVLEARLADERLDELLVYRPLAGQLLVDGVPESGLRRDREALRTVIAAARAHYRAMQ